MTAGPEGRSPSSNEVSDVVHLIGLPDAKPGIKGVLKLTPEALDFSTADIHALIPYKRITAVSVENERMEAGGQAGNAVPAGPTEINSLQIPQLAQYLDYADVMTYDFHGAFETNGSTNFQALSSTRR